MSTIYGPRGVNYTGTDQAYTNSPPRPPGERNNRGLGFKAPSLPLDSVAVTNPAANVILTSKRRIPRPGWYVISGMVSTSANAVSNTNMRLVMNADGGGGGTFLGTLPSRTSQTAFTTLVRVDSPGTIDVTCGGTTETGATYFVDNLVITEVEPGVGF